MKEVYLFHLLPSLHLIDLPKLATVTALKELFALKEALPTFYRLNAWYEVSVSLTSLQWNYVADVLIPYSIHLEILVQTSIRGTQCLHICLCWQWRPLAESNHTWEMGNWSSSPQKMPFQTLLKNMHTPKFNFSQRGRFSMNIQSCLFVHLHSYIWINTFTFSHCLVKFEISKKNKKHCIL